ncbi:MAG: hypothetical protein H6822_21080 [Planctomycetaceae bacterium]|nr:hypothetical protein [Planctomycetales bacterium]MCB9924687.1 hypothetical protein [Planctomycetaceae bacterium]
MPSEQDNNGDIAHHPTYSELLGEKIRFRRWRNRWNIADVVSRMSTPVDEATYAAWEAGTENIPIDMLPELAKALGYKSMKQLLPTVDLT